MKERDKMIDDMVAMLINTEMWDKKAQAEHLFNNDIRPAGGFEVAVDRPINPRVVKPFWEYQVIKPKEYNN